MRKETEEQIFVQENVPEEKPKRKRCCVRKSNSKDKNKLAPVWQIYRYNTPIDFVFMIIGLAGAVICGMGMPIFALLFQQFLNDFNQNTSGQKIYGTSFNI